MVTFKSPIWFSNVFWIPDTLCITYVQNYFEELKFHKGLKTVINNTISYAQLSYFVKWWNITVLNTQIIQSKRSTPDTPF